MASVSQSRYYVYTLSDSSGRVFYVGKGTGDRMNAHEREARKGCECHKCRKMRKIWQHGGQVQKQIVFTTNDEATAYQKEAAVIAQIGLGKLTNHHPGGVIVQGRLEQEIKPLDKEGIGDRSNYLWSLAGMTKKRHGEMMRLWAGQKLELLERKLKRAKHNRRLNDWDTTEEIARLEEEIEDIYIYFGWVTQKKFRIT
jgi:hypothetical protein